MSLYFKGKVWEMPVKEWFEDALRLNDPRPDYDALAREFKIIFHRHHNALLGANAPLASLKDVSPREMESEILRPFYAAVKQVLVEADKVEDWFGNYTWQHTGGSSTSLDDIREILRRVNFSYPAAPAQKNWEKTGMKIAMAVIGAMRAAGIHRRLSETTRDGSVAQVCAAAISWAFDISVTAEQFADRMRHRSRRKSQHSKTHT